MARGTSVTCTAMDWSHGGTTYTLRPSALSLVLKGLSLLRGWTVFYVWRLSLSSIV